MINDDPVAIRVRDLDGIAAFPFAKAVNDVRYSVGFPSAEAVFRLWLSADIRSRLPNPHLLTAQHVTCLMVQARTAGLL